MQVARLFLIMKGTNIMKKLPVALQLYSVRDSLQADFEGTLKKVKEMGYDGVEFAGLFDKSFSEVKALCDKYDLPCVSAHISFDLLKNDLDNIIEGYKSLGCKQVVIPGLPGEARPGERDFANTLADIKKIGEKCKENGMLLAYHNHDFEFVKVGNDYGLDVIYSIIPEDLLLCQLDTCWVNIGGENPAEYVKKYSGRMYTVHLKDFVGQKSENMYKLIGIDENEEKESNVEKFAFRPCGYGVQNFADILKASEEAGAEWVIVEQDEPALDKTPLECAEMSVKYLKSL